MNEEQEIRQEIEIFEVLMREMIQVKKVMQNTLARQLRLQSIQSIPSIQSKGFHVGAATLQEPQIKEPVEEICTDVIQEPIKKSIKKKKGR